MNFVDTENDIFIWNINGKLLQSFKESNDECKFMSPPFTTTKNKTKWSITCNYNTNNDSDDEETDDEAYEENNDMNDDIKREMKMKIDNKPENEDVFNVFIYPYAANCSYKMLQIDYILEIQEIGKIIKSNGLAVMSLSFRKNEITNVTNLSFKCTIIEQEIKS
eukprot:238551_1